MLYGYKDFYFICKFRWFYQDIAKDVETRFGTSNFELDRPLPKGKNQVKK